MTAVIKHAPTFRREFDIIASSLHRLLAQWPKEAEATYEAASALYGLL
jgi:hypothetical protein